MNSACRFSPQPEHLFPETDHFGEARQRSASVRWLHVDLLSPQNPQSDRYGGDTAEWRGQQGQERRDPRPHCLLSSCRLFEVGRVP